MSKLLKDVLTASERMPHRAHQLEGINQLVSDVDPNRGRVLPYSFALFDEVGAGKTKQVVDAAQFLYLDQKIDTVLVVTPGFARSTWAEEDPTLGEVAKHAWAHVPNVVHEFHGKYTDPDFSTKGLHWVVTNYEFVRRDARRDELMDALRTRRTWMVCDESWCIKGNSDQTRACIVIRRKRADRATILNGTPLSDGKPLDLYYQFAFLDPSIIGVKNKTHFRSKFCIMGGFKGKQVVDYKDLDELNKRVAPYVLSRRTRDCFDLPPMLPPITVEARLSETTWKLYRSQRDDMVTWLNGEVSVSRQAIVKMLRLSQITSGYLGGLESVNEEDTPLPFGEDKPIDTEPMPQWLRSVTGVTDEPKAPIQSQVKAFGGPFDQGPVEPNKPTTVCREVGREKLDAFLHWLDTFPRQPDALLVWCRFRAELERTTRELGRFYPTVLNLKGGQSADERLAAKKLLAPGSKAKGAVVGNQKAGGASLNFSNANIAVYLSNGPALIERTQSIGRIERPGATQPMLIVDVIACGPKGQKTIDHHIMKALRQKDDMARWTVDQWRKILKEE